VGSIRRSGDAAADTGENYRFRGCWQPWPPGRAPPLFGSYSGPPGRRRRRDLREISRAMAAVTVAAAA